MTQHILTVTSHLQNQIDSCLTALKAGFKAVYNVLHKAQMNRAITLVRNEMMKYKIYRDTYNELSNLSDRELSDIGIHRGDIHYIALTAYSDKISRN